MIQKRDKRVVDKWQLNTRRKLFSRSLPPLSQVISSRGLNERAHWVETPAAGGGGRGGEAVFGYDLGGYVPPGFPNLETV